MTTYVRDKWAVRFDRFGLAAILCGIAAFFVAAALLTSITNDPRSTQFQWIAVAMVLVSIPLGYVASTRFPLPTAIEFDSREIRLLFGPKKSLAISRDDVRGFRRQFRDAGVEVVFVRDGRERSQSVGMGYVSPEGTRPRTAKELCVHLKEAFKAEDEESSVYHYGRTA